MKRYHYTLAEQETIINWDNELDEATRSFPNAMKQPAVSRFPPRRTLSRSSERSLCSRRQRT